MQNLKSDIKKIILEPKRKTLINGLIAVITGIEKTYIPYISNPKYYEIWFYHNFDFNYTFIGKENFTVEIEEETDYDQLMSILEKNNLSEDEDEEIINKIKQECEFDFFSECWSEIENKIERKIRCFLIEHAVLRGLDVNKRELIDVEKVDETLKEEGIYNNS